MAKVRGMPLLNLLEFSYKSRSYLSTKAGANGNATTRQPLQSQPAHLHPEIRSVVQLTVAHARKIYFSGPLVRHLERQPDGSRPAKDNGWTDVWAQLGGRTLSIWDMGMIAEANNEGREVPPTYVNMTDAVCYFLNNVLSIFTNSLC